MSEVLARKGTSLGRSVARAGADFRTEKTHLDDLLHLADTICGQLDGESGTGNG